MYSKYSECSCFQFIHSQSEAGERHRELMHCNIYVAVLENVVSGHRTHNEQTNWMYNIEYVYARVYDLYAGWDRQSCPYVTLQSDNRNQCACAPLVIENSMQNFRVIMNIDSRTKCTHTQHRMTIIFHAAQLQTQKHSDEEYRNELNEIGHSSAITRKLYYLWIMYEYICVSIHMIMVAWAYSTITRWWFTS